MDKAVATAPYSLKLLYGGRSRGCEYRLRDASDGVVSELDDILQGTAPSAVVVSDSTLNQPS